MSRIRLPKGLCDEGECCPGLGTRLLVAFVEGAAPLVTGYLLAKLDPSVVLEDDEDEKDSA